MDRFKGKIVLVTGGNRNTGLDIVQKFVGKRPVRYMSATFRTNADRKLKNYFEAGFQNGGSRAASQKTRDS